MKTKEKIDELSEEFLTFHQEGSKVYHIKIREAIAFAYTQCQQDMDKKYTEEDMLKAFEKGALYGSTKNGNTHYFEDLINSLNKQD